jgi:hypothetical protein
MASRWAIGAFPRWRQCFIAKTSVTSDAATVWYHSVVKSSAAAHSFSLLGVSAAAAVAAATATTASSNSDNDLVGIDKECSNQRFAMIDATWNNRLFAARHWGGLCSRSWPTLSFGRTLTLCDDSVLPQQQIPVKLQRKVRMYYTIVSRGSL